MQMKKQLTSAEKYKRKMLTRRIIAASVLGVIIIMCICLFTPIFGVSKITVEGNSILKAEDLINTSGIELGDNIFSTSSKKAIKKLEKLPYVEDAKIIKRFPARLTIKINEAKNDIIIDTPDEFIVTTINGKVLYKTKDVNDLPVPVVRGVDVMSSEVGKVFEVVDKEKSSRCMEYVKCFYGSAYWSEINEFYVSDPSNFMLIMRSGMRVTFGPIDTIESLQKKIEMLDSVIPQVKPTERSYLDLTTDKGYFGEYTEDEYENIKKLREEDGEVIEKLTEEEPSQEEEDGTQEDDSGQ